MVAASVAAARGVVSANTISALLPSAPNRGRVSSEAINLPPRAATVNSAARPSVWPSTITDGFSSSPTDTRNTGTNTAEPKKSIRLISGPSLGTRRLSDRPAKNAPMIPSIPKISPTTAAARNPANVIT